MSPEVEAIIEQYDLEPLAVEGTLFLSTYRSRQDLEDGKPYGTAIIALHCNEPYSVTLLDHPLMKSGTLIQATRLD